jgi:hypothetical protein
MTTKLLFLYLFNLVKYIQTNINQYGTIMAPGGRSRLQCPPDDHKNGQRAQKFRARNYWKFVASGVSRFLTSTRLAIVEY